jgi:hypothetical protein
VFIYPNTLSDIAKFTDWWVFSGHSTGSARDGVQQQQQQQRVDDLDAPPPSSPTTEEVPRHPECDGYCETCRDGSSEAGMREYCTKNYNDCCAIGGGCCITVPDFEYIPDQKSPEGPSDWEQKFKRSGKSMCTAQCTYLLCCCNG